jgi:heme/copper-type cytochrome/quinol oxidase subunit 4/uncharacterized membrane protein
MSMGSTLVLHIAAGALGLAAGFVALYAAKGAKLHRKSGMVFVYAMLTMAPFGAWLAIARDKAPAVNIPAALLTAYLVVTALTTVRPLAARRAARWLELGALLVALAVGLTMMTFGVEALAHGGRRNGIPAFPFFLFGVAGLLGSAGDIRVMRSGARKGAPRLARHLWRMCFALFITALSFSVQIARRIPQPFRVPGLTALPVLAVLVTMLYWLWRVRTRRSPRRPAGVSAPEPA